MIILPPQHYHKLRKLVDEVDFNNLFAIAVIDRVVSGEIYVDEIDDPRTYYIVHRYGMSLLGGVHTNEKFNSRFYDHVINKHKSRTAVEWMQVFPDEWNGVLKWPELELNTRVNFIFDENAYRSFRDNMISDNSIRVERMDESLFEQMDGAVTPKVFWDSFEDFDKKGIGFCLFYNNELAATSFSSFLAPGKLEIGIETVPKFRAKGLAEKVCAVLIDYCLEHNLEPVWACRLENKGSYMLARKLGFIAVKEMAYYKINM